MLKSTLKKLWEMKMNWSTATGIAVIVFFFAMALLDDVNANVIKSTMIAEVTGILMCMTVAIGLTAFPIVAYVESKFKIKHKKES